MSEPIVWNYGVWQLLEGQYKFHKDEPAAPEWTVDLHDSSDDTAIILKAADEHGMVS